MTLVLVQVENRHCMDQYKILDLDVLRSYYSCKSLSLHQHY